MATENSPESTTPCAPMTELSTIERRPLQLPIQFGKYCLLDRLATGGTAEVFLAKSRENTGSMRFLIIKKILPYLAEDKKIAGMLVNEGRIASAFMHPNITRIIELGTEGNDIYIAMEFIRGQALLKICHALSQTKRLMPIPLAVLIISYICEGLAYAHQQTDAFGNRLRIVHQDITPRNIIISYDGEVKLIDFGMAKVKSVGHIFHGSTKGTLGYMSPEQLLGLPIDHRSDIYSVGVLLYELLTGTRMLTSEQNYSSIEQQRSKRIVLPSSCNSNISKDLEQVVLRTLAIDPDDRYETASKLLEDLKGFLMQDGTPINSENLAIFIRELFAQEIANENRKFSDFENI